ncbi:MAG: ABC transporter ATP-binding protein [Myxococcota bacterium]
MYALFERLLEPFPKDDAKPPPRSLVPFIIYYVREAAPWLFLIASLSTVIAVGEVYLFEFLGQIVDWLTVADRERFLLEERNTIIVMGLVLVVALPLAVWLQSLVLHQTLLGNLPMSSRWRMHRQLLGQSMSFFANEFAGRISTKLMQTALAVREAVVKLLDVFVYVGVYFIAMLGVIAQSDLRLAIPVIAWLLIYASMVAYFLPRLRRASERQADARSAMTGRIVDSYTNIATVKLFAHAGREEAYAHESMSSFLSTVHRQMRLATALSALVYFNNTLLVFALGALGVVLWLNEAIGVGAIAVSVGLALRLKSMSQWIMWEVSALFENIGVVYDGMSMLSKPVTVTDDENAVVLSECHGQIQFDRASFHYGKGSGVIEQLSLTIDPGEKIGLVGRSGAGKTTLVNLLLRFFDLEGGRILIDGNDIARITQDSLRAQIGVVSQDTSLLHRSIRENIAYGRLDASDSMIVDAARRANALDFIEELEDSEGRRGFDAQVGERGVKLSGGQRQRIAIARIFLKDAPILVLDEATSALDSEVEIAIQENLFALMEGKTVIAIAHRLSTIAAMDRLIVLDQGTIVEQGDHEQLVAAAGLYAELWRHQSGGFLTQPKLMTANDAIAHSR